MWIFLSINIVKKCKRFNYFIYILNFFIKYQNKTRPKSGLFDKYFNCLISVFNLLN